MNPIVIAAGVYLSARIISFIAGELTESEIRKQREIDDEIDRIRSRYQEKKSSGYENETTQEPGKLISGSETVQQHPLTNEPVNASQQECSSQTTAPTIQPELADDDYDDALLKSKVVEEKRRELCAFFKEEARARKADYDTLYKEIKESKRKVSSALKSKDVVQTPLRRSSLELLLRQLSEAQEKCFSYRQYLEVYCDNVWRKTDNDEPELFCMQLPTNYPYVGKVLWIGADQISGHYIKYDISDIISLSVRLTDLDSYDVGEDSVKPIMVTNVRRNEFSASLEKGAFKVNELTNTHLGISATVKEIQRQFIILKYQNQLELYLPKDNLIKPDRFPPVRSSLIVYPVKWEYSLEPFTFNNGKKGYPVTVSERKEDAGSSLAFKCFPVCFSEKQLNEFMDYYEKNNLSEYDSELLIGPKDPDEISLKKGTLLKVQFGDIPLFYLETDEYEDRADILRYFFRFHSLCESGEKCFSADDIFLPFNVGIAPYYAGTSIEMIQEYMNIDDIDDVAALIWDLFEEFRIQDQIRRDRKGMGYFFKWENITSQLISALEQGDSIQIKVKWENVESRNTIFADILNYENLEQFIKQFAKKTDTILRREWKPQFFVKDDSDIRYVATVIDAGKRLRIVGKNVAKVFSDSLNTVELFAANYPYAEYQQKTALRQFRIGQVANPKIQAACLNSSSINSDSRNCKELVPFHNKDLAANQSQKEAVEQAFSERNIFFIQGPPGTGKTTVIRELVEQVFDTDDEARILIVSQANVAVDNALSGLIDKYADQTVRCGNGNKISDEFQKLRLQRKCQEYLDDLLQRQNDFDEDFFNDWRETILNNESFDYSPVLCELMIRNHRLIGATCVGLAKHNIGLERTEFDLVIIDEAGKALPAEMLIPLVRAKKAIIIGDQRQLPPVINPILYDEERIDLEERAISENELFCHSFFEKLYENAPDSNKVMLDTQYRMPDVIGTVISDLFYGGKLKNGAGTEGKKPILFNENLSFINFDGNNSYREQKDSYNKSVANIVEAQAAVLLVMSIRERDPKCKIAVITPYKGQKRVISNTFVGCGIHYQIDNIYVDTIDSFQGSEADVVIFCTTRAVYPTNFFKNTKRLNVALSRAKRELIILGRLGYFYKFRRTESCLPALADYIKKKGQIIKSEQCTWIHRSVKKPMASEVMISLDNISLPTAYYMDERNSDVVQKKIDEFYVNGDFLQPLTVKQTSSGYLLEGDFEQFFAAQELNITECLCKVV